MGTPEDPNGTATPPQSSQPHSPDDVVARRQAYDGFVREHHRVLLVHARWLCGDDVFGEDLLQEALLEIWPYIADGEIDASTLTPAFVKNRVHYRFLDYLRSQRRREERHHTVGVWQSRTWEGNDPGNKVFDGEEFRQARELLSDRQWEIYVLNEAYGFSPTDIGARLMLKPRTVSNYLTVARRTITEVVRAQD